MGVGVCVCGWVWVCVGVGVLVPEIPMYRYCTVIVFRKYMYSCILTTPTSRPLTEYSVTGDREPMEKFEGEDEMLEKYEVYMKMLQLFNDLPSSQSWKEMLEIPYCMEHLKVH